MALEYLHFNNIIYRDIKPENFIFDTKGFLYLTDFGVAIKKKEGEEIIDSSGTPGYMAPEVLHRKNHDATADYYSLGVVLYELMTGRRPYKGRTRTELREEMRTSNVKIDVSNLPKGSSANFADFVNRVIFCLMIVA